MFSARIHATAVVFCALLSNGCQQGFKSANDLENDERGPKECSASCEQFGMRMSAFVLFEHQHSGCVCSPKIETAGDTDGSIAVAAGHTILMQQEQQRQQQAQQTQAAAH